VTVIGGGAYSMRVWLDPERLKARDLTTQDRGRGAARAERAGRGGQLGQPPASPGSRSSTR
jgi:HAE1 family hydrophobic/amphiphilic exporter-1